MYKLAEHVTEEMLIECGFKITYYPTLKYAIRGIPHNDIFILLFDHLSKYKIIREIEWNFFLNRHDITPYIQDLIDKGMVVK